MTHAEGRIFEKRTDRFTVTEGPGRYTLLITGFAEQSPIQLTLQRAGVAEYPRSFPIKVTELRVMGGSEYECWGVIGDGEEPFHGVVAITGKGGQRGWVESHDAWALRSTILACPNVDDIVPGKRIVSAKRRHIEEELLSTDRGWREIGLAKRRLIDTRVLTASSDETTVSYDFFTVFRDDTGQLTAMYRETVTFDRQSLAVKSTMMKSIDEPGLAS